MVAAVVRFVSYYITAGEVTMILIYSLILRFYA